MTQRNTRSQWTVRDEQMMRFLAEQWCADRDTIALLRGVERRRTYRLIQRWRDEFAMVNSTPLIPKSADRVVTVVWPRPSVAAIALGHPVSPWSPSLDNVAHKLAVARVRAALCGLQAGVWVPERTLLREAAIAAGNRPGVIRLDASLDGDRARFPRRHVHDGRYLYRGQWLSVEVELTLKRPSRQRVAATMLRAYKAMHAGDGLLYLYRGNRIGNALKRAIADLKTAGSLPTPFDIRLRDLDAVIERRSLELPAASVTTTGKEPHS
ncbi:MAG: hypothetical protein HOQ24_08680 [Mycobacteriaceae bacterium]|nr:hypothetical protein [Mycobacteriaceae bacterium]